MRRPLCLVLAADLMSLTLSAFQIRVDIRRVPEIKGDDLIKVSQWNGRVLLGHLLWGCTVVKRSDDRVERYSCSADPNDAILADGKGNCIDDLAHLTPS